MRTEVIKADSIDAAAERILDELKEDAATTDARSISSRNNVIYFDGWDGLGASAVLRAVAQCLAMASSEALAGLKFDQIIHVDCSMWESRRALQRAVAVQLELSAPVMDMLDRQDEEDDYNGMAKDSRFEIPQVVRKMYEHIQKLINHRFLVIFHNGSDEDVDLATICGFPLSGYSANKVLWTFQGAFRLKPKMKVDDVLKSMGTTDVFLSASGHKEDPQELWKYLVHQDAAEAARRITTTRAAAETSAAAQTVSTFYVANYFLYMWKLCGMVQHFRNDYDMATHSGNYWICDGVMQLKQGHQADIDKDCDDDGDGPWRAAAAVQQVMRLDSDYYHHSMQSLPSHLMRCADSMASMPYWTSPPHGVVFFSTGDTLQHFSKLGVLKLSRCTFSFSSPPFVCCHNLRFLWLDHCQDQVISTDVVGERVNQDIRDCFQRLWVLDVRYTSCDWILSTSMISAMTHLRELNVEGAQDWDIGQLQGWLPNIRKLRVTKSTVRSSGHSEQDLFQAMNKMELLDFSGNHTMQGVQFSRKSTSNNCLETVVVFDGCAGQQKLSFRGRAKLKNLLLSGLFEDLRTLDLSGTTVKILDLSAMTARSLNELILDNCDKLCAIMWPPQDKRNMDLAKVHIDTTQSASASRSWEEKMKAGSTGATGSSSSWPKALVDGARPPSEFNWYISIKDTRLLKSFVPSFQNYFKRHWVHVEISSSRCSPTVDVDGSESEGMKNGTGEKPNRRQQKPQYNDDIASMCYADAAAIIVEEHLLEGGGGNGNDAPTITRTSPCPPPDRGRINPSNCYLYTQDQQMRTKATTDGGAIASTIPSTICDRAYILHVHDSLYNTSIPGPAQWDILRWCRVERCPRLEFIFTAPQLEGGSSERMCWNLRTFWVSQLPRTRFMWDTSKLPLSQIRGQSFEEVTLLHLDFCPRLIHVLPFSSSVINTRYLETLEIVWCGDLKVLFPLLDTYTESHQKQQQKPPGKIITTVYFPNLKHVHLHELPKLESICGLGRMYAPKLETIKIRGCWSLRHLPAVSSDRSSNKVECDCEKDWWDKLEWDGLDGKHHPSLYKPVHSRYYKKKLLRGSVLK